MYSIQSELPFLKPLLTRSLSNSETVVEVVLHDLTKGYESTIVAIENASFRM